MDNTDLLTKLKIKIVLRDLDLGKAIPLIYGRAYYDYARREVICYIIPLNIIVKFSRDLYFALAMPGSAGHEKESYQAGFESAVRMKELEIERARLTAFNQGYTRGREDVLLEIEASISKRWG